MSDRRVARIITRLNIGGPSIQAINLSRELRPAGFETRLIHGHLGEGEGSMTALMSLEGLSAQYVDTLTRPVAPIRDLRALWRIYRTLRKWRPHIVHTHMAKAGALGRFAAVLYNWTRGAAPRARLVHTYHGHVFEGYFGSPSTRVFLAVERWLAKRSDALVAISPQIRQDIVETFSIAPAEVVSLIALGFNLERLLAINTESRTRARALLSIPSDRLVVCTVGRLTAIKQHGLFLEAAARIAERCERSHFLIVGDGDLRGQLEAQVRQLHLDARVTFLGWRGDLEVIYGATDVFLLTSRNEGTPVALIEAMASAVASVSTDVGGVRDVIATPEMGALVPFGDAEGLADAVIAYLDSADRRERTGSAARHAVAQRFDSRRLVQDIQALYTQLLSQPE